MIRLYCDECGTGFTRFESAWEHENGPDSDDHTHKPTYRLEED